MGRLYFEIKLGDGEKNMEKKGRMDWVDTLRGLGIIFMILGHVSFNEYFTEYIHAFHMPLFFFISGLFWNPKKYGGYKEFLFHDLRTLILPYTIFFLLFQPLHYIYTGTYDFRYALSSYFTSNYNRIDVSGAIWFLLCLFSCKQVYYLLERLLKGRNLCIAIIVFSLVGNTVPYKLPMCLDSALSCLGFIYLGQLIAKYGKSNWQKKWNEIPIKYLLFMGILNTVAIFYNAPVNIRTNTYGNIICFWINCCMAIVLWANLAKRLCSIKQSVFEHINTYIKYVGRNSIIYLTLNEVVIAGVIFIFLFLKIDLNDTYFYYGIKIIEFTMTMFFLTIASSVINHTKLK